MANKAKVGLTYFPMEVTFFNDIKTRKLIKRNGGAAISIYADLLCRIYKNGYYIRWDDELAFTVSEDTKLEEEFISKVITSCFEIGLLNQEMFDKNKILTSKGIQDRYELICKQLKRKFNVSEYKLIDSELLPNNTESINNNTDELLQSKVKESKSNETKENYLIKIGSEIFFKKCSEILQDEYRSVLELHLMGTLKGFSEKEILEKFDLEYPSYEFRDRNHLSNAVKGIGEKLNRNNSAKKENTIITTAKDIL